jgi:tetratricopeptide (TPR) repeat protein
MPYVVLLLILTLLRTPLGAHGDLGEQIMAVTREIGAKPRQPALYLKRGELYRALRNWDAALADYDRAASLDPRLAVVDLARGKLLLEAGRVEAALAALDRLLDRQPDLGEGLITRARVLVRLGRSAAAAEEYTRGIARVRRVLPEHYLERAEAQSACGRVEEAIRGLDEGIGKLGPVVTLELMAIDLEVGRKRYEAALARLERITARSPRKDPWLARRGEILEKAGRRREARAAYREALAALESLSPARRNSPSAVELEKRLRAALGGNKA